MFRAIEWLNAAPCEKVEHLGVEYDDTHLWIVALVGGSQFTLNVKGIKKARGNINISIVSLNGDSIPVSRATKYKEISHSTDEGIYANITKQDACHTVFEGLAMTLATYKKDGAPIITELDDSSLQN